MELDAVLRPGDVLAHLLWGEAQQIAMAVAVQSDLMTGVDDLARERGVLEHLLADQEEGGANVLAA